jgi:hypothetical protein
MEDGAAYSSKSSGLEACDVDPFIEFLRRLIDCSHDDLVELYFSLKFRGDDRVYGAFPPPADCMMLSAGLPAPGLGHGPVSGRSQIGHN